KLFYLKKSVSMNKPDLSIPTRQSVKGLALIFIVSIRQAIKMFWPMILILVIQNDIFKDRLVVIISVLTVLILLVVHSILYYLNFYFYVSNGEFILKKGYLRKKVLSIPLDRIQSVNTKQNLIQQLLDVVSLEIDTAGTVGRELKIHALENSFATELQSLLRSAKKEKSDLIANDLQEKSEAAEELILKLSPSDLLKIGISQNHLRTSLIIIAFGFQIFQQIEDIFQEKAKEYSSELIGFMSNSN